MNAFARSMLTYNIFMYTHNRITYTCVMVVFKPKTLNECAVFTLRQLPHWKKSAIHAKYESNIERVSNYYY